MARYELNDPAVEQARALVASRQYVLDSDWHLGLTVGAKDGRRAGIE